MGLTWDISYIMTPQGLAIAAQVVFAFIGGILNFFDWSFGGGLLSFAFWTTFIISGALALIHICNMVQSVESKFPMFPTIQLAYVGIWIIIYIVACVLSFFGFSISSLFAYVVLIAFIVDGFFKYKNYQRIRSSQEPDQGGPA